MGPAQSPCPPWARTHILAWGSSRTQANPEVGHKGWANGPHTVDLEYEPAQSLSDTLWNANFLRFLQEPGGAPQGGVQSSGSEVTLSHSQSREWLGTLL